VQSRSDASSLPGTRERGRHKERGGWFPVSAARWKANLLSDLYKAYVSFRSCRGHIRILFSKAGTRVDLGASYQLRDGCYQANTRILARAEGIEKLRATHPWVDTADLRIFLMGFDAGEEYSRAVDLRDVGNPELLKTRATT
jgi:hypothetical protein